MNKSIFIILLFISSNAWAGKADIDTSALSQVEFSQLSRQVGVAVSYKPSPTDEPLGLTGFRIGYDISVNDIDEGSSYWKSASPDMSSTLIIPRLHVQKGLPANIDVGVYYSKIPDSVIWLWGANIKYSLIDGDSVIPGVAISGSYSKIEGTNIHMNTQGLDLSVRKKLLIFTPYAGIGQIFIDSSSFDNTFRREKFIETRLYGGFKMSLGIMDISLEYENAIVPSYTIKLSIGI